MVSSYFVLLILVKRLTEQKNCKLLYGLSERTYAQACAGIFCFTINETNIFLSPIGNELNSLLGASHLVH